MLPETQCEHLDASIPHGSPNLEILLAMDVDSQHAVEASSLCEKAASYDSQHSKAHDSGSHPAANHPVQKVGLVSQASYACFRLKMDVGSQPGKSLHIEQNDCPLGAVSSVASVCTAY